MKTYTTAKEHPPTEKQLATLAKLGYVGDRQALTITTASAAISQLIEAQKAEQERRKAETDALIQEAKQKAENMSVLALAENHTQLRKKSANEWTGACPKCKTGDDRFNVTDDWFLCRKCHDKKGDYLEYLRWFGNISFLDACQQVTGRIPATVTDADRVQPVRKVATDKPWDEEKERSRAEEMHRSLIRGRSAHAKDALEYLVTRGINQETIEAYRVGFHLVTMPGTWDEAKKQLSYPKQLAISLPWFNHDGALVAVKYRFIESHTYTDIDGKDRTENKTSRGNMAGQMFGWQALKGPRTCHTLIICEGEMNALSLSLAGGGAIDVLSAGNESQLSHIPQLAIEKAREYRNVIVWADREEIADSAALSIPLSKRYHSPIIAGYPKGLDANDILKAGKLSALLSAMTESVDDSLSDEPTVNEMDVLAQVELLLNDADWKRSQAATWVYRWLNGYTEDTPHTRRNVETAAAMLGVQL